MTKNEALRVHTVSEITKELNAQLAALGRVWIEGEVSSFTIARSRHWYFDLKDDKALIRGIMFSSVNKFMTWKPKIGDKIKINGQVNIYGPNGTYSIQAYRMEQAGEGNYHLKLQRLRAKLLKEGLFDSSRKRPLPKMPRRIGIATSATGAALQDILKVLRMRFSGLEIVIAPCTVQGERAPDSIVAALNLLNSHGQSEVLIVGRGGGAPEDLKAFDDERVVRAIAASKIPTICAVGHEVDNSLSDLAADCRAATPSHAAEAAVPDKAELSLQIQTQKRLLLSRMRRALLFKRNQLEKLVLMGPQHRIAQAKIRLDMLNESLNNLVLASLREGQKNHSQLRLKLQQNNPSIKAVQLRNRLEKAKESLKSSFYIQQQERTKRLVRAMGMLDALSPLKVLERGYSIALKDNRPVSDVAQIKKRDVLELRLGRGKATVRVLDTVPHLIQTSLFDGE
ncbi:MAG: exodeoxyribonuclease VII large subunit [Proteobacteria bacterium]|nr:exodeoxyribonuclease VII large subunit [Pseudomonadota bacterium]